MRVTQNMITRNYLNSLNSNLKHLTDSNMRVASGSKLNKMSDNVADATQLLKVKEQIWDNEQYINNIRDAEGELSSAESSLNSIRDILHTAQEKMVRALSDTQSDEGRKIIGEEMANLRDQILQFANTQYRSKYMFSGTNNASAPFQVDEDTGGMLFNGVPVDDIFQKADGKYYYEDDAGTEIEVPQNEAIFIDLGLGLTMVGKQADPRSAFQLSVSGLDGVGFGTSFVQNKDDPNDEGDTLPNNVFNLLNEISKTLTDTENYDPQKAGNMLTQLKNQFDKLQLTVTDIGNRSNFLSMARERAENDLQNLETIRASIESTDDSKEAMYQKMYEYAWKATLAMGVKVIPPSIFDYMS